ncbi:MAG: 50S ribosomal protein L3 [Clostridia bacterium]|jgi:large subunit ribosomal protein L3|nr:50S ribosomal protein L3 [Clostridia bacterium]
MKSVIGYKIGMTQVFTEEGICIPVTVVEVEPNVVLQKRSLEKDGYEALVIGMSDTRENLLTKPELGQFKKANVSAKKVVKEIKGDELMGFEVGQEVTVSIFNAGDLVDVTGTTKGKGFAGVIKTYGHAIGPKGHGSGSHRVIGTFATNGRTNNRVHPGKKMPGHHTVLNKTILNLEVVSVDVENNALLIKGAIPGPKKGLVTVRSAVKDVHIKPTAKTLVDYTVSAE